MGSAVLTGDRQMGSVVLTGVQTDRQMGSVVLTGVETDRWEVWY